VVRVAQSGLRHFLLFLCLHWRIRLGRTAGSNPAPRNQKLPSFQQFPRTPQPSELTILRLAEESTSLGVFVYPLKLIDPGRDIVEQVAAKGRTSGEFHGQRREGMNSRFREAFPSRHRLRSDLPGRIYLSALDSLPIAQRGEQDACFADGDLRCGLRSYYVHECYVHECGKRDRRPDALARRGFPAGV
jgi:hypothetical protein